MRFQIPPLTQMDRLKLSATYLSLQRGLRRAAWSSVGWGAFTLAMGFLSKSHKLVDSVWVGLGFFLLLEGAWLLRAAAADPRVLQLEAATLLLLGLWNTVGLYFEAKSGIRPIGGAQIMFAGIVQLISAYAVFRSYPANKRVYEHLDRAALYELEMKIGDAWKAKAPQGDLAEFKVEDKKCKAKFLSDMVIVLRQNGRQVTLAKPEEVRIEKASNKMLSKLLKVQLLLEDEKLKTEMTRDCYERWQGWLANSSVPTATVSSAAM